MKIVVLCGGTSTERDVSISSGTLICKSLEKMDHEVILLDVYMGIEDSKCKDNVFGIGVNGLYKNMNVSESVPDIDEIKKLRKESPDGFFGPNVLNICKKADIVFLGLHGSDGENGKIQATFDLLGIKYTGTGYASSLLAMNKDLTRKVLISSGINMAKGFTIKNETTKEEIEEKMFVPAVVKPASGGSSVGVTIVKTIKEFEESIYEARKYDDTVVVEEYIKGREFSVGVLDGKALPIIEIIPLKGFYDYKNKYQAGLTKEICPANLDDNIAYKIREAAEQVYKELNLEVYSRIDFILSETNVPYCLEANTLPGMTPTSLLPQEAKVIGLSYEELCSKIIELSMKK